MQVQVWLVAVLLLMFRGSPALKLGITAGCALLTMAALPSRLWKPQLKRLVLLGLFIFFMTAISSGSVELLLLFPPSMPPTCVRGLLSKYLVLLGSTKHGHAVTS